MFLIDIQREQADSMRSFLSEPRTAPALPTDAGAARAGRRRVAAATEPRGSRTCAARRTARERIHHHLSRSRSSRTRRIIDGAFWNGAVGGARGVDGARASRPRSRLHVGDTMRSTSSAGRSRRGSPASARSTGATRATAASCSCSARVRSTRRRRRSSRRSRAARRRRGRGCSTIWSQQFPNVSVIDFREILEHRARHHVEGHARRSPSSAAWCSSAAR